MTRQKNRKSRQRRRDQDAGRSWLQRYGLAIGLIAVLAIIGLGAILRGRAGSPSTSSEPALSLSKGQRPTQPTDPAAEVSLDKSIGPADAPVVVVEYGDFQ